MDNTASRFWIVLTILFAALMSWWQRTGALFWLYWKATKDGALSASSPATLQTATT
jgi:hypothetical protein